MRNKISTILLGAVLIALGVGVLGNVFSLWQFHLFFDGWWSLFIIIPCVYSIISSGFDFGNVFGLALGVLLLLAAQDVITFDMIRKIALPVALILIGIYVIVAQLRGKKAHPTVTVKAQQGYHACFGGNDVIYPHEPFRGACCSAVFGGVKLDLRNAVIDSDQVITCSAIFGGIDILLPPELRIVVDSMPMFGGVENKYFQHGGEDAKTIYVKATCVFGGVNIK